MWAIHNDYTTYNIYVQWHPLLYIMLLCDIDECVMPLYMMLLWAIHNDYTTYNIYVEWQYRAIYLYVQWQ